MDKKTIVASAVSGLSGIVLGLLSARAIPQRVEVEVIQSQADLTQQAQNTQPKLPRYSSVHTNSYNDHKSIGAVVFLDDLAPGMKAFAEYGGKRIGLQSEVYSGDRAFFALPRELNGKEFLVYAIDRDGNKTESQQIFTLDGTLVDRNPQSK